MKKIFKGIIILLVLTVALAGCNRKQDNLIRPEEGIAVGGVGDKFRAYWFDFSVDKVEVVDKYNDKETAEGKKIVAVTVTLESTFKMDVDIYTTDFVLTWDDRKSFALEFRLDEIKVFDNLAAKETETYTYHYELPEETNEFRITFQEAFLTDNKEDELGDLFYIDVDLNNLPTDGQ